MILQAIGREAVPHLCDLLKDKNKDARWEAARALVEIASPSSARSLVRALEDKVFDVRWLAATALIKMGWPSLEPAMEELLLSPEPDWMWEGVRHVVRRLAKGDLGPMLEPLVEAFDGIDYRMKVPIEARKLLEELRALPQYDYY